MAKLRMKKIELIAMLTDSKKIIELLQRRGVVEISKNTDEELENTNVTAVVGEFEKFRSTAAQALDIIDTYAPEKAGLAVCSVARPRWKSMNLAEKPCRWKRSWERPMISYEIRR